MTRHMTVFLITHQITPFFGLLGVRYGPTFDHTTQRSSLFDPSDACLLGTVIFTRGSSVWIPKLVVFMYPVTLFLMKLFIPSLSFIQMQELAFARSLIFFLMFLKIHHMSLGLLMYLINAWLILTPLMLYPVPPLLWMLQV